MTLRTTLIALALLSQTGCVAAVPMIAQLASQPDTAKKLCSFAKMPGQTESFCDHNPFTPTAQVPDKAPAAARLSTAAR